MVDVLVIGAGGAGLTSALFAKSMGATVLVVNKSYPTNSQTSMAQGGINASLANMGSDSVESHISDTFKSANGLGDLEMIEELCQNAPEAIEWLESIGVPFSRTKESKISQRRLGGATSKRACYSQDYTGLKILHTLYDNSLKEGIDFLNEHYLLDLISDSGVVHGAILLDINSGEIKEVRAKSVIIATGGYGSIYRNFTTNSYGSTGDGLLAVQRAGGELRDMEFIQFHPTALKGSSILISESARGEGGYLVNSKGERFVDELLPRDRVAREIFYQIDSGESVYLDIRHLGEEKIMELLPQEVHLCRVHEGVDPISELIPIKPVSHYTMGGISVDRELRIDGLIGCFAVGECSSAKIHGANRLGGNSLLELIVFGKKAGLNAFNFSSKDRDGSLDSSILDRAVSDIEEIYNYKTSINFYGEWDSLGEEFYSRAGIIRDREALTILLDEVKALKESIKLMGIGDKSRVANTNLIDFLEFRNSLYLGEIVIKDALKREESRGAHFRSDFPNSREIV